MEGSSSSSPSSVTFEQCESPAVTPTSSYFPALRHRAGLPRASLSPTDAFAFDSASVTENEKLDERASLSNVSQKPFVLAKPPAHRRLHPSPRSPRPPEGAPAPGMGGPLHAPIRAARPDSSSSFLDFDIAAPGSQKPTLLAPPTVAPAAGSEAKETIRPDVARCECGPAGEEILPFHTLTHARLGGGTYQCHRGLSEGDKPESLRASFSTTAGLVDMLLDAIATDWKIRPLRGSDASDGDEKGGSSTSADGSESDSSSDVDEDEDGVLADLLESYWAIGGDELVHEDGDPDERERQADDIGRGSVWAGPAGDHVLGEDYVESSLDHRP